MREQDESNGLSTLNNFVLGVLGASGALWAFIYVFMATAREVANHMLEVNTTQDKPVDDSLWHQITMGIAFIGFVIALSINIAGALPQKTCFAKKMQNPILQAINGFVLDVIGSAGAIWFVLFVYWNESINILHAVSETQATVYYKEYLEDWHKMLGLAGSMSGFVSGCYVKYRLEPSNKRGIDSFDYANNKGLFKLDYAIRRVCGAPGAVWCNLFVFADTIIADLAKGADSVDSNWQTTEVVFKFWVLLLSTLAFVNAWYHANAEFPDYKEERAFGLSLG